MPLVRADCKQTCKEVVIPDKNGNPIGGLSCKTTCKFAGWKPKKSSASPSELLDTLRQASNTATFIGVENDPRLKRFALKSATGRTVTVRRCE